MKKISISRRDISIIVQVLSTLENEKMHRKGAYAIIKNKKNLSQELEILTKVRQSAQTAEVEEYHKKRIEICKEFADKDENGEPKINMNGYVVVEKRDEFNKGIDKLNKDNKEVVDMITKFEAEMQELLNEEVEIDAYMIKSDYLPEYIAPITVSAIEDFIEDDEE